MNHDHGLFRGSKPYSCGSVLKQMNIATRLFLLNQNHKSLPVKCTSQMNESYQPIIFIESEP